MGGGGGGGVGVPGQVFLLAMGLRCPCESMRGSNLKFISQVCLLRHVLPGSPDSPELLCRACLPVIAVSACSLALSLFLYLSISIPQLRVFTHPTTGLWRVNNQFKNKVLFLANEEEWKSSWV